MIAGLPYDAEVEYLESTGTQWIDMGVYGDLDTVAKIRACVTAANGFYPLIGSRIAYNSRGFAIYNGSDVSYKYTVTFDQAYRVPDDVVSSESASVYKWVDFSLGRETTIGTWNKNYTWARSFTTPNTLLLFAWNQNGTIVKGKYRVSKLELYEGGTLILDFIPVRFTNELGQAEGAMYDRVSRKLFRNQGTGAFVIGPDKAATSVPVMGLHFMCRPRYTAARDYVQDGLVAMWDGIENAGWGTHDAEATTWKDLVGSNDLIIYGSVQGNCVRTTNTAAAEKSGTIPGIATIEACYNLASTSSPQGLVFYSGIIDSTRLGLVVYGQSVGFQTHANKFWDYPTVLTPQKYSVSVTDSTCVVNGTVLSEVAHSTDTWNNGNYTGIGGRWWQNTWKAYGDYYCVRIYSRALTANEIAHNYAVDKERFNLP